MYRQEKKYILDMPEAEILKRKLSRVCKKDPHSGPDGTYAVTSLYFDDHRNSALHDNLNGAFNRMKFRIRAYDGDEGFIRLERKIKMGMAGRKDSAVLDKDSYNNILGNNCGFLKESDNPVLTGFYAGLRMKGLAPSVVVDYKREAYTCNAGNVRITFDTRLRTDSSNYDIFDINKAYRPVMDGRKVIMEVKYTGFIPTHIANLVQTGTGMRESVSKYVICKMNAMVLSQEVAR